MTDVQTEIAELKQRVKAQVSLINQLLTVLKSTITDLKAARDLFSQINGSMSNYFQNIPDVKGMWDDLIAKAESLKVSHTDTVDTTDEATTDTEAATEDLTEGTEDEKESTEE